MVDQVVMKLCTSQILVNIAHLVLPFESNATMKFVDPIM